jgi:hypothetical protein
MDSSGNCPIARSNELFRSMLGYKMMRPEFLKQAPEISSWSTALRMIRLADADCPAEDLSKAAQEASFMKQLSPKERGTLLQLWWERGDRRAVAAFLDSHPEYAVSGASTRAAALLATGQAEQACRLLCVTFGIPVPAKTSGSTAIQAADTNVPSEPLAAAKYYMEHGNNVAARHILEEAARDGKTTTDHAEIALLQAQIQMSSGDWEHALPLIIGYLHASGRL